MGGKGYYCDYCECYMKNDIRVRKKHIDGLLHKIAKAAYMAKYRDPHELLAEEKMKVPCSRFHIKGDCKFGLFCHFSHYTVEQIANLRNLVSKLDASADREAAKIKSKEKGNSSTCIESLLPWKMRTKRNHHLPISLRPMRFSKISKTNLTTRWG